MGPGQLAELFRDSCRELLERLGEGALLREAERLVHRLRTRPPDTLVLAGAGTSGRIAWLIARKHADRLMELSIRLEPWIAGGARALRFSIEGAEDDSLAARDSLGRLLSEESFFFGISCGLSAPCVAAGLVEALERGLGASVFGTNSLEEARAEPSPGIEGGFRGALTALLERGDVYLVTPDLGPELLTGSSRLKGGSATWLLVDGILSALGGSADTDLRARFQSELRRAHEATRSFDLAAAIQRAASSLRSGGRVFYLGSGEAGLAGLLDASECVPTFGARREQVQAFVSGGWASLLGETPEAEELEAREPLDLEAFSRGVSLGPNDTVFALGGGSPERDAVEVPTEDLLSTKLLLNAVSTGAFARAGKVYGNLMIDLVISNTKLFERASRIVAELAGVPAAEAKRSLVAALHDEDPPSLDLLRLPVEEHIGRARSRVVPRAILHAAGLDLDQATEALEREPVVRRVLKARLKNPGR